MPSAEQAAALVGVGVMPGAIVADLRTGHASETAAVWLCRRALCFARDQATATRSTLEPRWPMHSWTWPADAGSQVTVAACRHA